MRIVDYISPVNGNSGFLGSKEYAKVDALLAAADLRSPPSTLFEPMNANKAGRIVLLLAFVGLVLGVGSRSQVIGDVVQRSPVNVVSAQSDRHRAVVMLENNMVKKDPDWAYWFTNTTFASRVALVVHQPLATQQPPPKFIVQNNRPSANDTTVAASAGERNTKRVNTLVGSHDVSLSKKVGVFGQSRPSVSALGRLVSLYDLQGA